jgi:holo-[acyl-carrier protein] synthase
MGELSSLAARFAAKEAFGKALGTGLAGITLKDMAVLNSPTGAPRLFLSGSAQAAFDRSGASRIHLSLSHESECAWAMVVLEDG